jgi:tight adherence protein B
MDESIAATGLVAGAILLFASGFVVRVATRAREERFRYFVGQFREEGLPLDEDAPTIDRREQVAKYLNRFLSRRDFIAGTRRDLLRAGLQVTPTRFFLFRLLLALSGMLLGTLFMRGQEPIVQLVAALGGLVGGYLLVQPILRFKQQQRLNMFEKHFADALDILIGGLESGSSLTAAVETVSREMAPPISTEFARVLRDARLGMSYDDAFKAMHERLPSDDLGMFVSALSVQFRVGGNLATVLRTLAATVRDRLRIRGDIKTLTAQQRMTGWLVTAIPFAMVGLLLMVNRDYMREIFQPGPSRTIALAGVVLILIGNLFVQRILRIEV